MSSKKRHSQQSLSWARGVIAIGEIFSTMGPPLSKHVVVYKGTGATTGSRAECGLADYDSSYKAEERSVGIEDDGQNKRESPGK